MKRIWWLAIAGAVVLAAWAPSSVQALPANFSDSTVFSGLKSPTTLAFAPDGRIFVGEQDGVIKVFDGATDTTPTVFADLRTEVHGFWDRGLESIVFDPQFPARPYIYASYTYDAPIGGNAPTWGAANQSGDGCPTPPGATDDGCVVSGRLSRLTVANNGNGNTMSSENVLINDWCQQYPSHSVGDLGFGADGNLYMSAGDGASFNYVDYGQDGSPLNPCGDPPAGVGGVQTPQTGEGGALRSQDIRSTGDPLGLNGTLIRVNPNNGRPVPDVPGNASPSAINTARVVAFGFRNPFRFAIRPGTNPPEVWVGDVGWRTWEEINRVQTQAGVAGTTGNNFGWPCVEGAAYQPYSSVGFCQSLYASGGDKAPYYSFEHGKTVDPTETSLQPRPCSITSGSAISGVEFYDDGSGAAAFPAAYDGSLFFADYARGCIWVMKAGTNGLPDPNKISVFNGVGGPVDLEVAPDGSLYYVGIGTGEVHRISYESSNHAPIARATANPDHGAAPLQVQLSASTSSDPDPGDQLSYAWDLDGDGAFDDSTAVSPTRTYATEGVYRPRVKVTDQEGASSQDNVTVNVGAPPIPNITSPAEGVEFDANQSFNFSGSASDAKDGSIPASGLHWTAVLNHCVTGGGCHQHHVQDFDGVAGGVLTMPAHDRPYYMTLTLTATDSDGFEASVSRDIYPSPDSTNPQTTIDSGPSGPTNDPTPTFEFSSDEANSSFECKVDGGGFSSCNSPKTLASLPDGSHTFSVRATDPAGNTDPSPAERSFKVDTVAPTASISCPPAPDWSTSSPVRCTGSWNDPGERTPPRCRSAASSTASTPIPAAATATSAISTAARSTSRARAAGACCCSRSIGPATAATPPRSRSGSTPPTPRPRSTPAPLARPTTRPRPSSSPPTRPTRASSARSTAEPSAPAAHRRPWPPCPTAATPSPSAPPIRPATPTQRLRPAVSRSIRSRPRPRCPARRLRHHRTPRRCAARAPGTIPEGRTPLGCRSAASSTPSIPIPAAAPTTPAISTAARSTSRARAAGTWCCSRSIGPATSATPPRSRSRSTPPVPRPRSTPAPRVDQRPDPDLRVLLRRGQLELPVQCRRRGLQLLQLTGDPGRPARRQPHLLRPRHRSGRQHRPSAGEPPMSQGPPSSGGVGGPQALPAQPAQPAVPAGWYPHPTAPGWDAYWTGTAWGAETRPAQGAQAQETAAEQPAAQAQVQGAAAPAPPAQAQESAGQAHPAQDQPQEPAEQVQPAAVGGATAAPTAEVPAGTSIPGQQPPAFVNVPAKRSDSSPLVILCVLGMIVAVVAVVGPFLPAGWMMPIDAVYLAAGGGALLATAGLGVAILRIRGTAAAIAAALVVAAATIVSISLALSLFDAYSRSALIAAQFVVLLSLVGLWMRNGRPRPLMRLPSLAELRGAARTYPCVAAILLAVAFASVVEAVLALGVVPNNYDSMFYHLSRIGYWMQNDSVFQFYGGSIFQLEQPPNAEILQAWTMELTQGDRFAQFVEWFALGGLVCVIYAGARFLGFRKPGSLFAAAVFATLPLPVLEASSTINDLVSAFFVCAAALFLTRAIAKVSTGDAIVGALALGLAIGTKGTVLFALPGLALLGAFGLWQWRPPGRFIAAGSALLVLATLILGAPNYVETTLDTGNPIGEQGSVKHRKEPLPQSAIKTMWGFVDLPGKNAFPPLANLLARGERAVWGSDTQGVSPGVDVNEYFTGFGPIGLLLVLPLLAVTVARRGVPADRRLLAAAALSYIAIFLILVAAQPFDMRLMIIPVALGAPLLAYAAEIVWLRRLAVLVAAVFLVPVLFTNQVKPLRPGDFSLAKDLAAQRANSNLGYGEMLRNTEQAIADDQRVGFVGTDLEWDYPLFGPHFDRYVVRLPELTSRSDVAAAVRQNDLDAIVWGIEPPPAVRATLVNEAESSEWGTDRWVQEGNP